MSERRRTDRSTSVREIEFNVSGSSYPFVAISEKTDCRTELVEMVPERNGQYVEFFTVTGAAPSRVLECGNDHDIDIRLLSGDSSGCFFEFRVSGSCPAVRLVELGALPRIVRSDGGSGRIIADIPPRYDEVAIVDAFLEDYPNAELAAKREKDELEPMLGRTEFRRELHAALTDRQREVLVTAFESGYYDWPRESSGEDVASDLGITSATFSQHIHAAERKLLEMLFEAPEGGIRPHER